MEPWPLYPRPPSQQAQLNSQAVLRAQARAFRSLFGSNWPANERPAQQAAGSNAQMKPRPVLAGRVAAWGSRSAGTRPHAQLHCAVRVPASSRRLFRRPGDAHAQGTRAISPAISPFPEWPLPRTHEQPYAYAMPCHDASLPQHPIPASKTDKRPACPLEGRSQIGDVAWPFRWRTAREENPPPGPRQEPQEGPMATPRACGCAGHPESACAFSSAGPRGWGRAQCTTKAQRGLREGSPGLALTVAADHETPSAAASIFV